MALCGVRGLKALQMPLRINTLHHDDYSFLLGIYVC